MATDIFYRVKYGRHTIGTYPTREEAVKCCKDYARNLTPTMIRQTNFGRSVAVFGIMLICDNCVRSTEAYVEIAAVKQ